MPFNLLFPIRCNYALLLIGLSVLLSGLTPEENRKTPIVEQLSAGASPRLVILGTIQDAGSPQIGCKKDCCKDLFDHPDPNRMVVSLGLIDPGNKKRYLFEATPDMTRQLSILNEGAEPGSGLTPDGIFLTHAHIGHYTGLMYLGKEALNATEVPVYAMPRMRSYLETNGRWSQLVNNKNIRLEELSENTELSLGNHLSIRPLSVPHRDEYSETVGFLIKGPNKSALFIPDIDKWEKWKMNIETLIGQVDYAFLDATFFDAAEINNRDISTIPHPFVTESMKRFEGLPAAEKNKIRFIHFNHTNPLLRPGSGALQLLQAKGFQIATLKQTFPL
ncbi:MAG: MBL fold metallo-hydrolase [Chitinophagaceae bacterium]|nr:MBL fold metallo-hydrolase [Chitinophagaceae bacterium]